MPAAHSRSFATRLLSIGMAMAVVVLAVSPAFAASIQTDLWVYAQGDTVTVSGEGFGATEAVEIVTTDPNGAEVDRGSTGTDAIGGLTYQFVLNSDVPGIYDVVATGATSGISAATQFDPAVAQVTPSSKAYGSVNVGSSVSQTFTLKNIGTTGMNAIVYSLTGTDASQFVLNSTGAATTLAAGASTTFDVSFSPSSSGPKSASVSIKSNAPDASVSLTGTGIASDTTPPTVSMSSAAGDPTNTSPIAVNVTFSESVSGFSSADISATNGTVGGFSGSGANYSFNLTPSGQGTVSADIAANVATDGAGNGNTAATTFSRVYDSVSPTVSMSSAAGDPTNSSPIAVNVTFSEPVTGFTSGDISATNGGVGGFSGSGANYSFNLTPSGEGTVSADIAANVATDGAGNGNTAASTLSRVYDTHAPDKPVITSPADNSYDTDGDVTVHGTAEAGSTVELFDGTTSLGTTTADGSGAWSKAANGLADGSHTFTATSTDAAGNASDASDGVTVIVDTHAPDKPVITSPADNSYDTDGDVTVHGTAEAGSTVELFDGTTSLGTTTADGSGAWSKAANGLADGSHTFTATSTDAAGNASDASDGVTVIVDTHAPTNVTVSADRDPDHNGWYNHQFTATWTGTDPTSGIASCTVTDFNGPDDGAGSISGSCTDKAGNVSDSVDFEFQYDATSPSNVDGTPARVPDHNGWYNHAVKFTFNGNDGTSGIASCTDQTYAGPDSANASVGGTCTDNAGNTSGIAYENFKFDASGPTASLAVTAGTAGANGWYTSDVTIDTDGTDSVSGIESCTDDQQQSNETAGATFNGSCTNGAGLTTNASPLTVKLDKTGPSAALSVSAGTLGSNGWYTTDVTVATTGSDSISTPVSCTADQHQTTESTGHQFNGSCTNDAGLTTNASPLTVKLDKSAPAVSVTVSAGTLGTNGWYTSDVTLHTSGTDAISGISVCTADQFLTADTNGMSFNGSCTNNAGLIGSNSSGTVKRDATDPDAPAFVGGPSDGASYYFGSVPAVPTCTSSDSMSGLAGCTVSGYSTAVGSHTLTATATDNAGNEAVSTRSFTVLAWTMKGYYQPVDMQIPGGPVVWNTVKNGSTVPLKFEIFSGSTELTDLAAVSAFAVNQVSCFNTENMDPIELTTTGGTSLRYDTVGGQFIQNWQTPKKAGNCYSVTMTAQDSSTIAAWFKLK